LIVLFYVNCINTETSGLLKVQQSNAYVYHFCLIFVILQVNYYKFFTLSQNYYYSVLTYSTMRRNTCFT